MPVERVTAQQFSTQIANSINDLDITQDTALGPIRDIVIRPPARVLESQNERVRQVFNLLSLQNLDSTDPSDLDDFVFNEGLIRNQGARASTTVVFARGQVPTSDITVPINFPIGTDLDPATGQQIQYITTISRTMYFSSPGLYFNANTGKYELELPVRAVSVGVGSQVASNRLTRFLRSFSDFESVTNRVAATGGKDVETNIQLAQRYLIRIMGTDISTPVGLERFIRDFFVAVDDVAISWGSDVELVREEDDAGAVDCWILGESLLSKTDSQLFPGDSRLIQLDQQPVRAISTVTDSAPVTYAEGTDFELTVDTGIWSHSPRGMDGVTFLTTGASPTLNDTLSIVYTWNSLMSSLQSFFSTPDFLTFGRNILFREATEVGIILTATLTVNSGDPATVQNNVLTAISTFINTVTDQHGGLGDNIEEFDINREVAKVRGVDNFIITQLSRVGGTGVQDVAINKFEYAQITSSNLNVALV